MSTSLSKLIVQADPSKKGLHPYHDSRFITTDHVLEVEYVPAYGEHREERICFPDEGSIICEMRDCANQAEYAKLFAAAPEMAAEITRLRKVEAHLLEVLAKIACASEEHCIIELADNPFGSAVRS